MTGKNSTSTSPRHNAEIFRTEWGKCCMYTEGTGSTSVDSEPDSSPVASPSPIKRGQGESEGWKVQGGKTFCASFCASFIAGSRRAFLCVDFVRQFVCLSLREFWLRLNEMHKVWTFAPRKAFLLLCGFCFSSLENYFGLGTTNVKGKTDHSVQSEVE